MAAAAAAALAASARPETLPCYMVNNLTRNTEEQCKFIIDNDCLESEAAIDYARLVFCAIAYDLRWAAILLVLALVLVLFLNLSAVADEFLCPNLLTVAKNLRMSDSLAGVTLLAFGNGCPDIFSSIAAASSGRPEIIVGELLGAGIFCTSIVAGLIFIHSDFKLARRPLLRDAAFYLLAVFLMWLFCFQGAITFYGSLAFIIIYVIYLFFALSGQAIHARLRGDYPIAEEIARQSEKAAAPSPSPSTAAECDHVMSQQEELEYWFRWREESLRRGSLVKWSECCKNEKNTLVLADNNATIRITYQNPGDEKRRRSSAAAAAGSSDQVNKAAGGQLACCGCCRQWPAASASRNCGACEKRPKVTCQRVSHISAQQQEGAPAETTKATVLPIEASCAREPCEGNNAFTWNELAGFFAQLNPVTPADWAEANLLGKAILVLRAPLLLGTTLTVPVVNRDKQRDNWNRLLNSLQCVAIPIAVIVLLKLGADDDEGAEDTRLNGDDDDALKGRNSGLPVQLEAVAHSGGLGKLLAGLVPARFLFAAPGLALALFVFLTTSAHRAPRLHALYSYAGFAMSVVWIFVLATEIISILKTVGIIFSMTDTAIGLGVLAWGNSLGDIVANLTLAEAGHARMALGASIGAPLLNLLLGFGLAFCLSLKPGESVRIEYTPTTSLLAATLALVLLLLVLSTLAPAERSKKPLGYLLISCYGAYFALAVCLECGLIEF